MFFTNYKPWLMREHLLTFIVVTLVAVELTISYFFQYDIFGNVLTFLHDPHHMIGAEILFYIIVVGSVFFIQKAKKLRVSSHKNEIQKEKINAARITLSTVHDTVNNHLNGLLLVRLEAEKGVPLSKEMLQIFDDQVSLISSDLRKLDELDIIEERDLSGGIAVMNTKTLEN